MPRIALRLRVTALLAATALPVACSDVGDNTLAPPGLEIHGGADASIGSPDAMAGSDSPADTTTVLDASNDASSFDAGADGEVGDAGIDALGGNPDSAMDSTAPMGLPETGALDMGTPEVAAPDTGAADTGTPDAGTPDAASADAGTPDTGAPDTGMPDSGTPDAGTPDSATPDAGTPDAGTPDAGTPDAGTPDAGTRDAGAPDSGPSPCAIYNNPPGETTKGCTATEQRFVNKSVDCYTCLVAGLCLDDLVDTNNECEDLTGTASGGAKKGTSNTDLCLATIDCILSTKCASSDVASCYCGTLAGSACQTATIPGNGPCAQAHCDGANHLITDPASVVSAALGNIMLPAGMADKIFSCGASNNCAPLCSQ
jgi:hypothetical protein